MPPEAASDCAMPAGMQAWGAFLAAHADLIASMDRTLREQVGMSLQWYDALAQIDRAGRATTMRDLEQRVLLSQSGVSRLVARLDEAGLVTRSTASGDRRSVELALTPEGRRRLRVARTVQAEQVRVLFADRMSEREASVVLRVLRRFADKAPDGAEAPAAGGPTPRGRRHRDASR